jgi:hypothetical protein
VGYAAVEEARYLSVARGYGQLMALPGRRSIRSARGLEVALVLPLAACSGPGRPSLDWGDYDPSVKQRIDAIVNEPTGVDCRDLGDEFADAKASDADDLMAWINWKAYQVGCFPERTGPFS